MKIKNVEIGGYIQSKKDSKQLIAGHCYQVAEKDVSDKTVRLFSVDDSFDDSLWFFVSDFRKPRPQPQLKQLDQSDDTAKELLEVDLSSELTGSELCRAMLARGDKYVSGFGHHHSDRLALESKFADTVSKHTQCFQSSQNAWDYFVPINNQGEPLTASEVGL